MADSHGSDLIQVVALLGAGVVAVPIFKRLGLGSVIGYLAAGMAIGPFGIRLFTEPETILGAAPSPWSQRLFRERTVRKTDDWAGLLAPGSNY